MHPENGLNQVSSHQIVSIESCIVVFTDKKKSNWSSASKPWNEDVRARGGGWNIFKSHPLHVLQCLEKEGLNGFVRRNRTKKRHLPFPSRRQSPHTDGLPPVESRAGGRCIVKKRVSRRVHFYCLHWLLVINCANECMQNTASIVHLLTWQAKRAEITECKPTKRAHPRRVAEGGIL